VPRSRRLALIALPAVAFVLIPVIGLAVRAPWSDTASSLSDTGARTALLVSLEVTLGATLLSLILGLPVAWALARIPFRGRRLVRAVVVLPIVLPPVVAGVALLAALGRLGFLGKALDAIGVSLPFTTAGAAVAAAFVSMPFLILALEAGFRSIDPRLEEQAGTLGASNWHTFVHVTLPLLRPQLVAGLVLTWARALGEFGATITFAGNFRGTTQTLPLAVFQALQVNGGGAILLSLLMLSLSVAILAALGGRVLAR
jgi:molybdate transport system permease protein